MPELLAPAGSLYALQAAVDAGADAVYIGGQKFGARAYADNPDEDGLIKGIEYCHLRGKKLYLTVNTLFKEPELRKELIPFIEPLYRNGLDGVILQDLGVMRLLRRFFPDLELHASTQMSVTTPEGARWLNRLGVSRVVPARELSIQEVRAIAQTGVEVEAFIHGAMCYCYSGRCLFSSVLGGRSGNRGRCAQPCRLPYECPGQAAGNAAGKNSHAGSHLLSMKDLCTLDILPELIEAGIASFKIEGRMKRPEYAAGTAAIYREYMDLYAQKGLKGYQVREKDRRALLDLFDRGGFSRGYYHMKNGPSMIAFERPKETDANAAQHKIEHNQHFLQENSTVKINGDLRIYPDTPVILSVWTAGAGDDGSYQVKVSGPVPEAARTNAATREDVLRQMYKTGGTPFEFEQLKIDLADGLFLPVRMLNELRREALDGLKEQILRAKCRRMAGPDTMEERRPAPENNVDSRCPEAGGSHLEFAGIEEPAVPFLNILVTTKEQIGAVLAWFDQIADTSLDGLVDTIYLDSALLDTKEQFPTSCVTLKYQAKDIQKRGIHCLFGMPPVLREAGRAVLEHPSFRELINEVDGFLVQTIDELSWLQENSCGGLYVSEGCLYSFNKEARELLGRNGISRFTLPAELNAQELRHLGGAGGELVIYGREPLMQSAQCVRKNTSGCGDGELLYLKDRKRVLFPVLTRCLFCTNTIYNSVPLHLAGCFGEVMRIAPSYVRLSFTVETREETRRILGIYERLFDAALKGDFSADTANDDLEGTRGHFKRGVE